MRHVSLHNVDGKVAPDAATRLRTNEMIQPRLTGQEARHEPISRDQVAGCQVLPDAFQAGVAKCERGHDLHQFPFCNYVLFTLAVAKFRAAMSAAPTKKYVCGTCRKGFDTKQGRRSHARSKQHLIEPPRPAPAPLLHRGIAYSTIHFAERAATKNCLSDLCHSEARLLKEGFRLPSTTELEKRHPGASKDASSRSKSAAIVLDCEMATTASGEREVIQIGMVDFLSGTVLQNCLVNPSRPIVNWKEDITGINALRMQEAVSKKQALHGWEAARAQLWRFADDETVIIGQSVNHDLKVLHTSHTRIIDSAILTADAVLGEKSKNGRRWGLETLCSELLNIKIRQPSAPGSPALHDALEDAFATREVVLLCARHPEMLQSWASKTRKDFFKNGSKKQSRPRKSHGQRRVLPKRNSIIYKDEDEGGRWEDFVDWDMWPKSPPDSD